MGLKVKRTRVLPGHAMRSAEPNLTPTLQICQCELLATAAAAIRICRLDGRRD